MNIGIVIGLLLVAQVAYLVNAFWFMKLANDDYPSCQKDCDCQSEEKEVN